MSHQSEPKPPRLSTGVELEFAVIYVFHTRDASSSEAEEKIIDDDLPQPLEIEFPKGVHRPNLHDIGQEAVQEAIIKTLRDAGFPTEEAEVSGQKTQEARQLDPFRHCQVASDTTIKVIGLEGFKARLPLRYAAIEIGLPVEWESPLSFEVVRYMINLLASKFRIQINPTMGLHIHVGNGAAYMPFQWVKRISMMSWAAERLLATLHPPTRSFCTHCMSIRGYSPLAHGVQLEDHLEHNFEERLLCERYIARAVRFGEESTLWREAHIDKSTVEAFTRTRRSGCFESFIENSTLTTSVAIGATPSQSEMILPRVPDHMLSKPKRLNTFPRLKLPRYTEEDAEAMNRINGDVLSVADLAKDRGIWYGIEQIARTESSCQIEGMLHTNDRANYSFLQCSCLNMGHTGWSKKKTIEWRQGAGTMDARWVATWLRIVTGVSRFAMHSPTDEFLRIIRRCDYAEEGGSYDVLDLLEDIGLVAEAAIAGERIKNYRREWCQEYEDNS
ncbi:hypothetical protein PFICI_15375 [Pestalotiopsis fici W106-1]|uniref:Amidoligase enzyme n=1 Tax=Pestalotiopsis fici (strain W106-1 / CGMCC3.15140) TaxID=1229662 RepID=W3WGE8_PESFW|nr:uncharacterized protein PFICI_15375 [Pestalotiopsis fici W106-1]ETS72983.1 hypothetical protein PFICI_15375 [Pestalotiopsis fici W106-1]